MKCIALVVLSSLLAIAPRALAASIDAEAVASHTMGAVLVIQGKRIDNGAEVQGSGCCIHPDGYVLATAHQAEGVTDFVGRFSDGTRVPLTLIESRPEIEFALFKAATPLPVHAVLGDASSLKSGAPLLSIAAPMNLEFSTVTGSVSNPNRTLDGYAVMQVTLTATHGSSGGPVFDRDAKLVGLISGGFDEIDFTIVNKINNAFAMLSANGLKIPGIAQQDSEEYTLVPAAGISEAELRSIEAYNRGVATADARAKIEAYRLATTLLPAFYEARFNLAIAEAGAGQTKEAIESYRRAASLRPEALEVRRNLGRLYLREKKYEDAVAIFEEALRLAPQDAQGHNDLGEAQRRAGRTEEAITHFEESLRLNPDAPGVHYNLALALATANQAAEASKHFEAYLTLAPQAKDADEVRAWINKLKNPQ